MCWYQKCRESNYKLYHKWLPINLTKEKRIENKKDILVLPKVTYEYKDGKYTSSVEKSNTYKCVWIINVKNSKHKTKLQNIIHEYNEFKNGTLKETIAREENVKNDNYFLNSINYYKKIYDTIPPKIKTEKTKIKPEPSKIYKFPWIGNIKNTKHKMKLQKIIHEYNEFKSGILKETGTRRDNVKNANYFLNSTNYYKKIYNTTHIKDSKTTKI